MSKAALALIVLGALFLGGTLWLGVKIHSHFAAKRALEELKQDNPVEYYVMHTPKTQTDDELRSEMAGIWKLVGARSFKTGEFVRLTPDNLYFKTFTTSTWSIATYDADSNVVYSAGGHFTLQGDLYTESIEQATGTMKQFMGARPTFRIRLIGDDYYQMRAGRKNGIEEQWHRVDN